MVPGKVQAAACLAVALLVILNYLPGHTKGGLFPIVNDKNEVIRHVQVSSLLRSCGGQLGGASIRTDPNALLFVVRGTLKYLETQGAADPMAVSGGMPGLLGCGLPETIKTLRFVQAVLEEDFRRGAQRTRLQDPAFLNREFRFIRYTGDVAAAHRDHVRLAPGNVRITKYAVFVIKGSATRTAEFPCALYAVPDDEKGLSVREAEARRDSLVRFRYTKQDVLAGAFEKDGPVRAQPLVWLTRDGLEEALMEGTIYVDVGGRRKVFNVDRCNGIPYVRSIKDARLQRRYWYFREAAGIKGYGLTMESKITLLPKVAFAGDVVNMGLGKLIAVRFRSPVSGRWEAILGVLADTGGAFAGNMYQLDFLAGVFPTKAHYRSYVRTLPESGRTYFLFRR
jgi:hypothetical protein